MKKVVKHSLLALAVILLLTFIVGRAISHKASKNNNFIGVVGGHVYVDNSSGKILGDTELQGCWSMLYSGAPGPFLEFGRLITQRMEITQTTGMQDYCGFCTVRLYTIFNIPYLPTRPLHRGCA
ncbi:MAG: hypothetical protein HYT15_00685 [Candidatus Magasanikbacteria bacterium]|nr:hypothetical protein [Candidatus Magasanikbacteria bacterium]